MVCEVEISGNKPCWEPAEGTFDIDGESWLMCEVHLKKFRNTYFTAPKWPIEFESALLHRRGHGHPIDYGYIC